MPYGPRVRTRVRQEIELFSRSSVQFGPGTIPVSTENRRTITRSEKTSDSINPIAVLRNPQTKAFLKAAETYLDIGGNFLSEKSLVLPGSGQEVHLSSGLSYPRTTAYSKLYPISPAIAGAFVPEDTALLNGLGNQAMKRSDPSNPLIDVPVFLGELREGFPRVIASGLLRSRLKDFRELGSEYLNVEFGWKPFLSDIFGGLDAHDKAIKLIRETKVRGSKVSHRRYDYPITRTTEKTTIATGASLVPVLSSALFLSNTGTVYRERKLETQRWFSGAFRHYVPDVLDQYEDQAERLRLLRKEYGLRLTPDALWELAPWSWMLDWFINVGDVLANVSNLVSFNSALTYGYIMEHVRVHDLYWSEGVVFKDGTPYSGTLSIVTDRKSRRKASPFGFGPGYVWDGFSQKQLAILAALGISRG